MIGFWPYFLQDHVSDDKSSAATPHTLFICIFLLFDLGLGATAPPTLKTECLLACGCTGGSASAAAVFSGGNSPKIERGEIGTKGFNLGKKGLKKSLKSSSLLSKLITVVGSGKARKLSTEEMVETTEADDDDVEEEEQLRTTAERSQSSAIVDALFSEREKGGADFWKCWGGRFVNNFV